MTAPCEILKLFKGDFHTKYIIKHSQTVFRVILSIYKVFEIFEFFVKKVEINLLLWLLIFLSSGRVTSMKSKEIK